LPTFLSPFEETAAGEGVTLFDQGINPDLAVFQTLYHLFTFLAVLADFLKSAEVGAPLLPGFRIFSLDPASIRSRFA
jgi:hypothetical protein